MAHGFEEEQATRRAAADAARSVRLTSAKVLVTAGPDAGLEATIGAAGLVVGTGQGADLRLSDRRVSRAHLSLRAEPDGVRLTELGSRNGTYFAGARVHDLALVEDASVVLGETTLLVRVLSEPLDVSVSSRQTFGQAIARSAGMRHVFELLEQAARTDVTVLLEGESGTGKEVLAHALHEESPRKDGPFVVVDCGAIPEKLVESELFGHERGAFTGAVAARAGAFEQASEGTLFLDEIGELPLEAQPKLLRALESRSFRRVGGSKAVHTRARVVAATNRKLREAVRKKEFRGDLFYRLAVVHVTVPQLRDRPDDVLPLAESFLRRATGDPKAAIPAELSALLMSYSWPGNARELRNVVERFATFGRTDPRVLFGEAEAPSPGLSVDVGVLDGLPYHEAKQRLIDAFHRGVLPRAVDACGGNVARAAEQLGLPKASLYRMLQQLRGHDPDA
ncbi:MAG: sigma 54-interacting transcriptional regulator [Polyangiaceae bacterium]